LRLRRGEGNDGTGGHRERGANERKVLKHWSSPSQNSSFDRRWSPKRFRGFHSVSMKAFCPIRIEPSLNVPVIRRSDW
jgi:hypothetical protein